MTTTQTLPESTRAAAALVMDLSHEIENLRALRAGRVAGTFALSEGISSCFLINVDERGAHLGVPPGLFEHFLEIRWRAAAIVSRYRGLFLVMRVTDHHDAALRLSLRPARMKALAGETILQCWPLDERNRLPHSGTARLTMPIQRVESLVWEDGGSGT